MFAIRNRFAATTGLLFRPSPMMVAAQKANFSIALDRPRDTLRTNVDCEEVGPDSYRLCINMASRIEMPFTSDSTLQELHDTISASTINDVQSVQFYTLNGHRLPLCERIGDQRTFPVLL